MLTDYRSPSSYNNAILPSLPSSSRYPREISAYRLHRQIGRGAFGQVFLASLDNTRLAIKIIDKLSVSSSDALRRIRNEVSIHSSLTHKNVLGLFGAFEDGRSVYLVMEACGGGELGGWMKRHRGGRLGEIEAAAVFKDVCRGLEYVHREGVMHRDLKLSNVLLGNDGIFIDDDRELCDLSKFTAKIGDFGLACRVPSSANPDLTLCGTPNYLAPEVVLKRPYGQAADLWSLGCLLYTMLLGKPPFEGRDVRQTLAKVSAAGDIELPEELSVAAKDLLKGLLCSDPAKRLQLSDVLEHPFVTRPPPLLTPNSSSDRLTSIRLKPLKQTIKHGTIDIGGNGDVAFTVDSDQSTMVVSSDGLKISFSDRNGRSESCGFAELGRAARRRYDYMRKFVELVRKKTPLVHLRTDAFRMTLYDGLSEAVLTVSGLLTITYTPERDAVDCVTNGTKHCYPHPTYRSVERLDDHTLRRWLVEFLSRLEQLKRVAESILHQSDPQQFPLVIDESTAHTFQSPLSITRSVKSFESTPSSQQSVFGSISQLRQSDITPAAARYVSNIGWCVQCSLDTFLLLFNDGTRIELDKRARMVRMEGLLGWLPIDNALPPHIKLKLQHVPSFLAI